MLGLSKGLIFPEGTPTIIYEPSAEDLVGWWDFTDINTLYQDKDSYDNIVTSNNQQIGRIKNKAGTLMNGSGPDITHMGSFLRAPGDSDRPNYKNDGANGLSYGQFYNLVQTNGLVARSTSTDWGGYEDDVLMQRTDGLKNHDISIFVVGEPGETGDAGAATNDPETPFSYYGYYKDAGTPADESVSHRWTRQQDGDILNIFYIEAGGVSPNLVASTSTPNHWRGSTGAPGTPSIIHLNTHTTAGQSYIYTNGNPDPGQSIRHPGTPAPFTNNGLAHFDPKNWDDSLTCSVGIGSVVTSNGTLVSGVGFEGKIYEVLVYSTTSDDIKREQITSYLKSKYSIT